METVYELDNRGFEFIYHWFYYILAGLRTLEVPGKRVKVVMPWFKDHGFHNDSFKYFEDSFEFLTSAPACRVIRHSGEPLLDKDRIAKDGYLYVRQRLLKGKSFSVDPKKRVYITRKGAERLVMNKGIVHHSVINEAEMYNLLTFYGFEVVQLENLSLDEKIELFCTAKIIMGPFGGGLTFSGLMSPEQTLIELVTPRMDHNMRHYKVICELFGIKYVRFMDVNYVAEHGNIHLKLDNLARLLQSLV